MKKQLKKLAGLACYLVILTLLFDFNWLFIFKPKPLLSVVLGMLLLTASQYKKEYSKDALAGSLRWNSLFASFLTTLISMLSSISPKGISNISGWSIAETLLPMFYGSIIYIILSILFNDTAKTKAHSKNNTTAENPNDLISTIIAEQVFKEFNLTGRECHVALKLLEDTPNKEIASQLYISETTVKKHIQNIYRKFGATGRSDFQEIYIQHAGEK